MTNDTSISNPSFGARLKLARETIGLETKDAASELRLNEKYILMMEKENYPTDLPLTFIRGYLRAYGRLLHIPIDEIDQALEQFKLTNHSADLLTATSYPPITHDHYFIRFSTYLILLTFFGLMSMWWFTRSNSNPPLITATIQTQPPSPPSQPVLAQTVQTRNNTHHNTTLSAAPPSPTSNDSEEDADIE